MGNQHSQQYGQAGGITQQGVRVGAHSNIPNDAVPYQGPRHQYCFINVEATLSTQGQFSIYGVRKAQSQCGCSVLLETKASQGSLINSF